MIRGFKIAGLVLLALVLLVIASVGVIVGTQAGSRWALDQVPGLHVDNFAGRLGSAAKPSATADSGVSGLLKARNRLRLLADI